MCDIPRTSFVALLRQPEPPAGEADPLLSVARRVAARAVPVEAAPARASRRRRLWEMPRVLFCPILGTCVPITQLRRLASRVLGDGTPSDDYDLHCLAISECARRSELAEALYRDLEQRHVTTVRRFAGLRGTAVLQAAWREAMQGAGVAEALWATLTHPDCDAALEEQVQRDIHMLQHQVGVAARADVQRLRELVHENGVLTRELAAVQQRVTQQMTEKASLIERQQAALVRLRAQLIARDTTLATLRDELATWESRVPGLRTRQELAERVERQQQRIQSLERALQQRDEPVVPPPRPVPVSSPQRVSPGSAAAPVLTGIEAAELRDKAVLCVGGRTASVPVYRQLIEDRGARFLHHDGGDEEAAGRLDAHLAAADLVICQAGCISHGAYWRVKDHCKRTGKPCVFVERPSASGLLRCLSGTTDRVA